MDDVFFEVGPLLGNEIGALAVALEQIVHLGFDDLLNVRFFDIVGGNIKTDPQGAYDNYAEYGECQRDTKA
jgi:hypothetical protein